MKISQIRYFQSVCKCKSITKATQVLHITQPSLSKAIKELETEFNVNLFNRINNRLSLTSDGQVLLNHANEILEKVDLAEKEMHLIAANQKKIRIGIPTAIGSILFPPIFSRFKKLHPDVQFEVQEFDTLNEVNRLEVGTLDLSLSITNNIDRQKLNFVNFKTTDILFYTSVHNKLAEKSVIPISLLEGEPLILLNENSYQYQAVMELFQKNHLKPNIIHRSNQLNTIRKFIQDGLASSLLIGELLECDDSMITIPFEASPTVYIGIMWKKGMHLSALMSNFIEFVKTTRFFT